MRYKLIISKEARSEIKQAVDWYEDQSEGLGRKYALTLDKCVELILKNPFGFAVVLLKIRRANMNKFPYSLFYYLNEDKNEIIIFAVLHQSRSERVWKRRAAKG